ncbi:YiiX family permuted papain-like enzyme [Flavobacterium nitrogenifigens]|uniref:Permuted papain-like amidase enzyme, YaeF/YiiX, C92 family n=1 Tax=Flavobacterium nitrogenifigens TaxID=1617283 RepID=A0A521B730_9FLAO|nr:YiiX family permuted papain-like enzyme [Flavobacterium nitrogenifigens]KAF2334540.1 YiiX family permuted papain-like enzyme [Flavobacterium nitrogenifigens]SMO42914.1 Permuted papain-like amidase enzyme, YaeF/YiiX, C92 family [Flavobacterium nitrogenifigens]
MKIKKYLFPIITFIISFGCALFVAIKVFPNNTFTGNKEEKEKTTVSKFKDGDLIFQTSESKQCEAVRIATNSKFSHCGIIYDINGNWFVFEAVQPVKLTPLEDWIKHGKDSKYLVKRLKDDSVLNPEVLQKMKDYSQQFDGKEYDAYFEWTDNRIYCSELIWKIYKNAAGIELSKLRELKDFNLQDPRVQKILKERYGNDIPLEEKVVTPSDIAESNILKTVVDTY